MHMDFLFICLCMMQSLYTVFFIARSGLNGGILFVLWHIAGRGYSHGHIELRFGVLGL